jgi:hypothetical protein
MLYMYLAVPAVAAAAKGASGAVGGMSATGARFSVLALALALFMFGYVAWVGDRLTARAPAGDASPGGCVGSGQGRPYLAPRCAAMCKIAMGITMGYVLILML